MFYVGIDPGVKGAIAIISKTGGMITVEAIHDMPVLTKVTTTGKTRYRIDVLALHQILSVYPVIQGICLEDVASRPGEGAVQSFSFGHGLGCVETVSRLTGAHVTMIVPRVWKGAFGLSSNKDESRHLAQSLTGDHTAFKLKKHDGRAEAVLLALYASSDGLVEHQGALLDAFRLEQAAKPKKGKTGAEILADLKARVVNL